MSFLEEEYLRKISYKLRNFKIRGGHSFQWSCPICGDSKKKLNKARGYAYDKHGSLIVGCFNCGYGTIFPNFLKEVDPIVFQEFVMERFKDKIGKEVNADPSEVASLFKVSSTKKFVPNIFTPLHELKYLEDDHPAKLFAINRKLPIATREFFYVEKFMEWTLGHTDKFKTCKNIDHPRVIIPFKARDGHYIGYTARALNGEEPKYFRIFIDDVEKEKFYGIERLDETKRVYVLEGEIDSMFLPNAIAVSNGKLDVYLNKDAVYIPDADKRNPHIVTGIGKLIDKGLRVCLLPDGLPGKDINELIIAGLTEEKILDIINKNVYQGLSGKMKFNNWRVV
jgi:hypothetical protein